VGKREEDFTAEFAEAAEENKESRGEGKGILSQSTLRTPRKAGRMFYFQFLFPVACCHLPDT